MIINDAIGNMVKADTGLPDVFFSNQKIPIWANFGGP
jgi:hypothetical protein